MSRFIAIYNAPNGSIIATQLSYISNLAITMYAFRFVVRITSLKRCDHHNFVKGSFYIYVCVSTRFHQQLIYVLFTIHLNQVRHWIHHNNQIETHT